MSKAIRNLISLVFVISSSVYFVEVVQAQSEDEIKGEENQLIAKAKSYKERLRVNSITMSLEDCVEEAVKNNPNLLANYNYIQQNEWNLIAYRRRWLPTINASSTLYNQAKNEVNNFDSPAWTKTYSSYAETNPKIALTWYFIRPTLPASINTSLAQLKSQRFTYDYTARSLILEVQKAYINVQAYKKLVQAYEDIYKSNQQQVDYLSAQLDKGMIDIGSLAQSKTTMYAQLGSLVLNQQNLIDQATQLAQLIGIDTEELVLRRHLSI